MVTAYNALLVASMIGKPAAAAGQIAHVAVEHGDGGGRLFHELPQAFLALAQGFRRLFLRGDIAEDF